MDETSRRVAADLAEALAPLDPVVKAMFGGYCYYVDGKVVGLVNDGRVFVKRSKADEAVSSVARLAPAYQGAKESWQLPVGIEVSDPDGLRVIIRAVADALPPAKPRNKRS